jgi:DNA-directed RNA polymerase specialized sigma24 family protein
METGTQNQPADWFGDLSPAVAELPERHRRLVILVYVDGFSLAEAASKLGVSRPAATKMHKNVLARLTNRLLVVRI